MDADTQYVGRTAGDNSSCSAYWRRLQTVRPVHVTEKSLTSIDPTPPNALPTAVVEAIEHIDEAELGAVIDLHSNDLRSVLSDIHDRIQAGPGEEIVRIEENPVYTTVVKRQPCGEDCEGCPHGPLLYHVQKEPVIK